MKKLILGLSLFYSLCGFAQVGTIIDAGTTQFVVNQDGQIGPIEYSGIPLSYKQALWVAGSLPNGDTVASGQTFKQARFNYSAGPGSSDSASVYYYDRVWVIRKTQIDSLQQGLYFAWNMPSVFTSWPANGRTQYGEPYHLAPFVDVDSNGVYDPFAGDYPIIHGDICAFSLFNDSKIRDISESGPAMLIDGLVWHYTFQNGGVNDRVVYSRYELINRSSNNYHNVTVGIWNDAECGFSQDDLVGTFVDLHTVYAYNADNNDDGPSGFGNPPYSATIILDGPEADIADGIDNNWDGCVDGVSDGQGNCIPENAAQGIREPITLTGSMYFNNSADPASGNPRSDIDYHNMLNSKWLNGNPLVVENPSGFLNTNNGDGYTPDGTGNPSNFFYPGATFSPLAGWLPVTNTNWFESVSNSEDKRFIASMGTFTWEAGESISIINASFYGFVQPGNFTNILDSIRADADSILGFIASNPLSVRETNTIDGLVDIRQNEITLFFDNNSKLPLEVEIVDMNGRVLQSKNSAILSTVEFEIEALPEGVYIIRTTNGEFARKWIR